MRRFEINAIHADNHTLRRFVDTLPTSFDEGGTTVWNKRNKIKIFTFPSPKAKGKDIQIVVKRYKKPNFLQKLGYILRRHKADKAFHNALQLIDRGFATPEPLAFVELRKGRWWLTDAYYICGVTRLDNIEGQTDRNDWNRDLAAAFAHFVAELHEKGVLHHDLNDTNVLYERNESGQYHFEVIDINRMAFYATGDEIPLKECIENIT
ncbi:MAG: lipopolysaccharide kinase InaA family protein, partial [Bacteroidaceae bacterium]